MSNTVNLAALGLLLTLALVWGSSFFLIDKGLEAFSPLQVAALRMVIAGAVLIPFVFRGFRRVKRGDWPYIAAVALVGNGIPAFLFPLAETVITPASAGILNTLSPVFALILGVLFFGFYFSGAKVLGISISFAGALVLILSGAQDIDLTTHMLYSGLVVLAALCYGLSVNLIKKYLQQVTALDISTFALLMAGIPYGVYLLTSDWLGVFDSHPQAWASLGFIAILGALGTAFALVLFNRLVQLTDPVVSASVTYLIPIVAVGWDLFAGKPVYGGQLVGMGIILLGVFLVNKR